MLPGRLCAAPWVGCPGLCLATLGVRVWYSPHRGLEIFWWLPDIVSFKARGKKVELCSLHWSIIRYSGFSVELLQSFLYVVERISSLGGIHPSVAVSGPSHAEKWALCGSDITDILGIHLSRRYWKCPCHLCAFQVSLEGA